nr:PREDICTED: actin-related protein 5 [Bemisia tabaci]
MEVFGLKDLKTVPDIFHPYTDLLRTSGTPIVIDNGSYQCRVGWASAQKPNLIFKNVLAKPRKERGKKVTELQVGNDITNMEAVRLQLKSQFDRNVVTHYDVQEQIFDYSFSHLSINTEQSVNHPILLTEAFLNPNYCRQFMSELLFECYQVPAVCYGVDCLFSYQKNNPAAQYGLVVGCGYHCIHIIPIVDFKPDYSRSRRIDIGGFHVVNYLYRLLQLKYPAHFAAITPSRAEELIHEHSRIAIDYKEEVNKWADLDYYNKNVRRIQLPFNITTPALTPEQQLARRKELAKKLVEMNARKREERLAEEEEQLNQLLAIQEMVEFNDAEKNIQEALKSFELKDVNDLIKSINQLRSKIEKTKQKICGANVVTDTIATEEPKLKIMKEMPVPKKDEDMKKWISDLREKRQRILDKRSARKQRKQDMAKRRTAASWERMRIISQLAGNKKDKRDDDFGMRDEDWDVYKVINKDGGDSDSEEEQEKLIELEEVLRQYDPVFSENSNEQELNPEEAHQLHFGTEHIRAPEVLFQPSMIGVSQAGIAETIEYILKQFNEETATNLVSNIFITGGCGNLPGLKDRLRKELMEIRPFQSTFNISEASNLMLDSWFGAKEMALSDDFAKLSISVNEYEEKGMEYFKEHFASNVFVPSPSAIPVEESPQTSQTPVS